MNNPDITIVLNLHREGVLVSYTLRSLADTALHAASKGLSAELVAVLDDPDDVTRSVIRGFRSEAFVRIEMLEVANRSLGPSRNAGIDAARGAYVAITDGDDLYSFNYLAAMHETSAAGDRIVALPKFTVWFGQDALVQRFLPLARSGRFRLVGSHTFVSCIMAPTPLLRDLRYRDCARSRVYAYEDYDLNCRAVAAGADIRIASDAVFFYRRHSRSIMASIGDATRFIVPPSAFFDPDVVVAAGDGIDVIDDPETLRPDVLAYRRSHRLRELVSHAASIEPRIELSKVRDAPIWTTAHFERGFGAAYYDLCRQLGAARFDDVLVVPALADCPPPLLRIAETSTRRCLIIEIGRITGMAPRRQQESPRVVALDGCKALPANRRPEMVVRLIHAFAKNACLHLVLGVGVDDVLASFTEALAGNNIIVYDMRSGDTSGEGRGRLLSIEADVYASIDLVISDEALVLDTLVARIPIYAEKVMLLGEPEISQCADRWLEFAYGRREARAEDSRWTTT